MTRLWKPALALTLATTLLGVSPTLATDTMVHEGGGESYTANPLSDRLHQQNNKVGDAGVASSAADSAETDFADEATKSNTIVRASTVIGRSVVTPNGDQVGSIEDVVLDLDKGGIRYAAVSMGGVLGMGDKLFAIPWDAMKHEVRDGEHVCLVPVSKERLQKAEGFDQNDWPNMSNQQWRSSNDAAYR